MTPEIILPILKWTAIISVSGAFFGGVIAGYLDCRASNARKQQEGEL